MFFPLRNSFRLNLLAHLFLSVLFLSLAIPLHGQVIQTVAGDNLKGDGGPAINANLLTPFSLAVDSDGNLFISDPFSYRVRKVSPAGIITTVAGNGMSGSSDSNDGGPAVNTSLIAFNIAVDNYNNLYMSTISSSIRKVTPAGIITTIAGNGTSGFSGDGGPATSASLSVPYGVTMDKNGNLFIGDVGNRRVRKIDTNGIITTIVGNGVQGFSGDAGPAIFARFRAPSGIAITSSGNLYIADSENRRIRKVSPTGIINTIAGNGVFEFSGDGGPAINANLYNPNGVAVDKDNNFYIADRSNHRIRKVSSAGVITTVAGSGRQVFSGDGGPATNANINSPTSVALDKNNNLYIADLLNNRVRKVSSTGIITTIAGNGTAGYGGDGGLAVNAQLNYPIGIAVDSSSNLFIVDQNNHCIRRVDTNGTITTIAGTGVSGFSGDEGLATNAQLNRPFSVAVDNSGNIYIADGNNRRIRKVSATGIITTIAGTGTFGFSGDGGPAINANMKTPIGLAISSNGNLYFGDFGNYRVRMIDSNGIINTIAGNGFKSFSGDSGLAVNASLTNVRDVAIDSVGNLFIVDSDNQRIRKVILSPIASAQTGNWSNSSTWNCNCLPTIYDTVTISANHNVTVSEAVQAKGLRQLGNLIFSASGRLSF
ncbi:hypothetical protein IC229_19875 [Spirosoma sp. BT702]|uniref:Teneurin NHL domain-containing protein n=1 Tax=Spirosoma profusum TaxID=2771354 RepID=A0A927AT91_9BACT|nr:hypothetical protein [Spirosoma profusum]MBD2702915.1 hypothetical protein [Spirosoma profusum]